MMLEWRALFQKKNQRVKKDVKNSCATERRTPPGRCCCSARHRCRRSLPLVDVMPSSIWIREVVVKSLIAFASARQKKNYEIWVGFSETHEILRRMPPLETKICLHVCRSSRNAARVEYAATSQRRHRFSAFSLSLFHDEQFLFQCAPKIRRSFNFLR